MIAPSDKTVADLLHRHLALIRAPIPIRLPDSMTSTHILNRCGNLQVDLLAWRHADNYPQQLANQLHELSMQHDVPAMTLQLQLALLVQKAIEK